MNGSRRQAPLPEDVRSMEGSGVNLATSTLYSLNDESLHFTRYARQREGEEMRL
jgi:hypothetical protein